MRAFVAQAFARGFVGAFANAIARMGALAFAAVFVACANVTPLTVGQTAREALADLPATFSGTLSCAACPSVSFSLVLRPDNVYYLRTRYRRPDSTALEPPDELGRWAIAPDSTAVMLRSRPDVTVSIAIAGERTLVVPAPGATSASDSAGRTLQRASTSRPFVPRLAMNAMYSRDARGARLRDCASDLVVSVSREAGGGSLDSAYAAARLPSGVGIMANVVGRIESRPRMEDAKRIDMFIVEQFKGVVPGDTCGLGLLADDGIIGHTWRLSSFRGDIVAIEDHDGVPYFTIDPHETRVRGFGGCNRFGARARLNGPRVMFSEIVATKMACDRLALETKFFAALDDARAWRVDDTVLELLDDEGSTVATFLPRAPAQ